MVQKINKKKDFLKYNYEQFKNEGLKKIIIENIILIFFNIRDALSKLSSCKFKEWI